MNEPELPWTPILIVLAGTALAAGLVFGAGWSVVHAYLLMATVAAALALTLVIVLLALTPKSDWGLLVAEAKKVMREDIRALRRMVRRD